MSEANPRISSVQSSRALFKDPAQKAVLEARNSLIQFDEVVRLVEESKGLFNLTPELIKRLQLLAIRDIYACAGRFRDEPVIIGNSLHQPPPAADVDVLVGQMCDYVNSSQDRTPIHTAAYLMWRLNWIHPFAGGNGRTSRAVSHYALCARLGFNLPGKLTIPEQITRNRGPYYDALDAADAQWKTGTLDLTEMERLMSNMLARQLVQIHTVATQAAPQP